MPGRDPAAAAVGTSPSPRVAAACVALACLAIVAVRARGYGEPFDRDVGTYAVIAREMRHGRLLYTDLFDHKPPAIYGLFAAAQAVAGVGEASVFVIGVFSATVTALALFSAGARVGGAPAGVVAAASWAALSADLALQADQPNVEAPLNACLAIAFAALVAIRSVRMDRPVVTAGVFLGLAMLFKPVVAPDVAALALAHVLIPPPAVCRRRAVLQASVIVALCAAPLILLAAYFALRGRSADAWLALVTYNASYGGSLSATLREGLRPSRLLPAILRHATPLAVVAVSAPLSWWRCRRVPREWALLIAWLVSTPVAVALPGKFFPHYYQLWLPPLCIAAAWAVAAIAQRTGRPAMAAVGVGSVLVVVLGLAEAPIYALSAEERSRAKYGDVFIRSREVALEVERLAPGETLFVWGNEPEIYLYTGLPPPTGVLWADHMMFGATHVALRSRALQQLSIADPELVVWSEDNPPPPGALGRWFRESYVEARSFLRVAGFSVWLRRGGAVERRLQHQSIPPARRRRSSLPACRSGPAASAP